MSLPLEKWLTELNAWLSLHINISIVMKTHKNLKEALGTFLSPCSIWSIGTSAVGLARRLFTVIADNTFKKRVLGIIRNF